MRFTELSSSYVLTIDDLLKMTVDRKGSDLHLAVGMAPCIRINGELVPVDAPPLKAADVEYMILSIIQDYQKEKLENDMELDFSYAVPGYARFRGKIGRASCRERV